MNLTLQESPNTNFEINQFEGLIYKLKEVYLKFPKEIRNQYPNVAASLFEYEKISIQDSEIIDFHKHNDRIRIDKNSYSIFIDGKVYKLTESPFYTILPLLLNLGENIPLDSIYTLLHGSRKYDGTANIVRVNINKLKKIFKGVLRISNTYGKSYKLDLLDSKA